MFIISLYGLNFQINFSYLENKRIRATISLINNISAKVFINLDSINESKLLNLWPNDFQNSVYYWMNENSQGLIQDFSLTSNMFY